MDTSIAAPTGTDTLLTRQNTDTVVGAYDRLVAQSGKNNMARIQARQDTQTKDTDTNRHDVSWRLSHNQKSPRQQLQQAAVAQIKAGTVSVCADDSCVDDTDTQLIINKLPRPNSSSEKNT